MAYKWLLLIGALLLAVGAVAAVPQLLVEPTTVATQPNREFTVQININTDQEVYGIQFDLVYDQNVIGLTSIAEGNFLNRFAETYVIHRPSQGISTYAITRTIVRNGVAGAGTVATARFRALRAGQSSIQLNNVKVADPRILPIEGVRESNSMVGVYGTSTAPPSSPPRRRSGGGGGGSSETTPGATLIAAGIGGDLTPEPKAKETAKQPMQIALKGAGPLIQNQVAEEKTEVARSIFPIVALIVAALGALTFAYRRLQ